MSKYITSILAVMIVAIAAGVEAQTPCPQHFAAGLAPAIFNKKLTPKYRELCNSGYAVGHSGLTRTPLWSAEHLTRARIAQGRGVARVDNFRPDTRIPAKERSELRDYSRSGLDRGHLSPAQDFADDTSKDESFLLSNIIPQDSENNRGIWSAIESVTRHETNRRGDLYVITGPVFVGNTVQALRGRVLIPTNIYKCLYDASRQEAGCYWVENSANPTYQKVTVAQVESQTGINIFPAMTSTVKNKLMRLSEPRKRRNNHRGW